MDLIEDDDEDGHECTASEDDPCDTCASMGLCPYCASGSPWRCGHEDQNDEEDDDDEAK